MDLILAEKLNDRELDIILYRFGFIDDRVYTLEEVGKMYGVTRERIRQIEARALKKLKSSNVISQLADYGTKASKRSGEIYRRKTLEEIRNF